MVARRAPPNAWRRWLAPDVRFTRGLDQIYHGGEASAATEAHQYLQLHIGAAPLYGPALVWRRPPRRLIDSGDQQGGDEGGEQHHHDQYRECLVVQYISVLADVEHNELHQPFGVHQEAERKSFLGRDLA